MANCVQLRASDGIPSAPATQPLNPRSLFKKPDIFCRFSACLHILGAISILIGCLLIKAFTTVGIIFLFVGFIMTVAGIVLVLAAVYLVLRKSRNRKYRNINRKFCEEYRSCRTPGGLKVELVSSYFTPIVKARSQSLTGKPITASTESLDTPSVEPRVNNLKNSKVNIDQNNRKITRPELTVEPPPEERELSPMGTPTRRLALSPSICSTNTLNDENNIPFYPPRGPPNGCPERQRCSPPESMSRSMSKCSLNSQLSNGLRSRSVSPQRHKSFIN